MQSFRAILSVILSLCLLCACTAPTEVSEDPAPATETAEPGRIIVAEYGSREQVGYAFVDLDAIETVAEMSTQIVICMVLGLEDMKVDIVGTPSIHYQMYVLDILMDVNERLSVGDTVTVTSGEGIIPASFAYERASFPHLLLMKGHGSGTRSSAVLTVKTMPKTNISSPLISMPSQWRSEKRI